MSAYTLDQLIIAMNEPVVHPTEPRQSKMKAIISIEHFAAWTKEFAKVAVELSSIAEKIHIHYEKVEAPLKFAKSPTFAPKEHTKRRFTNEAKEDIKGHNGAFIRIAIHKKTRKVGKVNVSNWSKQSIALFEERFPTGFAVKTVKAVVEAEVVNPITSIVKDIRRASKTRRKNIAIKKKAHTIFKRELKKKLSVLKKERRVKRKAATATKILEKEMNRRRKFDGKLSSTCVRC